MKYNDTKFITHENFQLSSFQKCAKFYTHENFYVYGTKFVSCFGIAGWLTLILCDLDIAVSEFSTVQLILAVVLCTLTHINSASVDIVRAWQGRHCL